MDVCEATADGASGGERETEQALGQVLNAGALREHLRSFGQGPGGALGGRDGLSEATDLFDQGGGSEDDLATARTVESQQVVLRLCMPPAP